MNSGTPMRKRPVYLTFHGIGAAPASVPVDEVPHWIEPERFAEIIASVAQAAKRRQVDLVATFDDGYRSDIETAAPLLQEHGVAATFFPCAGRIGEPGFLDAGDLRALKDAGFGVGSHGMDHRPWGRLQGDDLRREVAEAKAVLEAALGSPVTQAALPFGSYNRRALAASRKAGFEKVFSSDPGVSADGAWFTRRFCYKQGRRFDLEQMMDRYSTPCQRVILGTKHRLKAWR